MPDDLTPAERKAMERACTAFIEERGLYTSQYEGFAAGYRAGQDSLTRDGWRCECGDLNREHEAFCYRCGAGQPEGPSLAARLREVEGTSKRRLVDWKHGLKERDEQRARADTAERHFKEARAALRLERDVMEQLQSECSEAERTVEQLREAMTNIQGESYLAQLDAPDEVPDPLTACRNINKLARDALKNAKAAPMS